MNSSMVEEMNKGLPGLLFKPAAKRLRLHLAACGHVADGQVFREILNDVRGASVNSFLLTYLISSPLKASSL